MTLECSVDQGMDRVFRVQFISLVSLLWVTFLAKVVREGGGGHFFFCESSLLRTNHSTLQRGMLHTFFVFFVFVCESSLLRTKTTVPTIVLKQESIYVYMYTHTRDRGGTSTCARVSRGKRLELTRGARGARGARRERESLSPHTHRTVFKKSQLDLSCYVTRFSTSLSC